MYELDSSKVAFDTAYVRRHCTDGLLIANVYIAALWFEQAGLYWEGLQSIGYYNRPVTLYRHVVMSDTIFAGG